MLIYPFKKITLKKCGQIGKKLFFSKTYVEQAHLSTNKRAYLQSALNNTFFNTHLDRLFLFVGNAFLLFRNSTMWLWIANKCDFCLNMEF